MQVWDTVRLGRCGITAPSPPNAGRTSQPCCVAIPAPPLLLGVRGTALALALPTRRMQPVREPLAHGPPLGLLASPGTARAWRAMGTGAASRR